MGQMFIDAASFNSDLSKWDVSRANDMYGMFMRAKRFNSALGGWDVSSVTNFERMSYAVIHP